MITKSQPTTRSDNGATHAFNVAFLKAQALLAQIEEQLQEAVEAPGQRNWGQVGDINLMIERLTAAAAGTAAD